MHVGNYLGALKNFVDLQNSGKYECYFFVADLHAITEPQNPDILAKNILDVTANYFAAGVDPEKSMFFLQSFIPAHSELAWILNTIAPLGDLERMTQFKEKGYEKSYLQIFQSSLQKEFELFEKHKVEFAKQANEPVVKYYQNMISHMKDIVEVGIKSKLDTQAGLLNYPVLMAADVLLYDAQAIPVGDDQLQHLELARTLARKFNAQFGKTFIEPKSLLTKTPRVMSLKDPAKKMSKSQPEGCLFLDDSPKEIVEKIARAVTDSGSEIAYDSEKKPGLSNLLEIYAALTHMEPQTVAKEFAGEKYSDLKKRLAEVVVDYFAEFRSKKQDLLAHPKKLVAILEDGSKKAAKVANKKMEEVRKKIGIAL